MDFLRLINKNISFSPKFQITKKFATFLKFKLHFVKFIFKLELHSEHPLTESIYTMYIVLLKAMLAAAPRNKIKSN